jgi:hypothetical protein
MCQTQIESQVIILQCMYECDYYNIKLTRRKRRSIETATGLGVWGMIWDQIVYVWKKKIFVSLLLRIFLKLTHGYVNISYISLTICTEGASLPRRVIYMWVLAKYTGVWPLKSKKKSGNGHRLFHPLQTSR